MKKTIVQVIMFLCLFSLFCGCREMKDAPLIPNDPYNGVYLPKADLEEVTLTEAVCRLLEMHKTLRSQHVAECMSSNSPSTFFPGLHVSVLPLSKRVETKKVTVRLSQGITFTQAFKKIADCFGVKLLYRNGCFVFDDPNYNPLLDSVPDPFGKAMNGNESRQATDIETNKTTEDKQ